MNVLLIWPKFDNNLFWRDSNALNILRRTTDHPPLGLITVAAMLPADWQKRLVDINITDLFTDNPNILGIKLAGGATNYPTKFQHHHHTGSYAGEQFLKGSKIMIYADSEDTIIFD